MKTIRRIVLKWARFMDKRRWGMIYYSERKFPNLKWWKGLTYQLCIKTIRLINKIDPKKDWRECWESWRGDEMFPPIGDKEMLEIGKKIQRRKK